MYGFLGKWIGLDDAKNTLGSCLDARSLPSDVMGFIRYKKQILKKPAELSVRGKIGWAVAPAGIHVATGTCSGHQMQIFEIRAQNLWVELE